MSAFEPPQPPHPPLPVPVALAIADLCETFWSLPDEDDDSFLVGKLRLEVEDAVTRFLTERAKRSTA